MKAKRFSVWVGDNEVNSNYLTEDEAYDLAEEYAGKGNKEVYVMDNATGECNYIKG